MAAKKSTTTPSNKTPKPPKLPRPRNVRPISGEKAPKPGEPLRAPLLEAAQKHVKPKAPAPPRDDRVENFERELPCKLTDSQIAEKNRDRIYIGSQIDEKQSALDQRKKAVKQELEAMQLELDSLVATDKQTRITIQLGVVNRLTKCQRVFSYRLGQVSELRLDTVPSVSIGEPRAMTPAELDEGRGNWEGTAFAGVKVKDDDEDEEGDGKTNPVTGLSLVDEDLNAEPVDFL